MQYILCIGMDFERYLHLKDFLSEFSCVYSVSVSDGIKRLSQQQFSLIVLDLSLISSDSGQKELLGSFRHAQPVPIIALCDSVDDSNIIRLLEAGADQVLVLQTPDEVLAAYVHTLINRYTLLNHMDREWIDQTDICVGDFTIDIVRRQVFLKDNKIDLSGKEFDLMLFFAQNPERVLTEDQIFERVWHTEKEFHSSISKLINRLRQKIEPDHSNPVYIRSVRGIGYQFIPKYVESCDI